MKRMTIVLTVGLLLAACSGDMDLIEDGATGQTGGGEQASRDEDVAPEAPSGVVDVGFDVIDQQALDRRVVRTASLQLHADDTREIFDEIVSLTESIGGFVASANVLPAVAEDRQPDITIVLRVPAGELTTALRAIKGLADEVVSESQDAQDVSAQFVDLEARLTNLQALEAELRTLLEEVSDQPDVDPEKLLRVFTELGSVRGQIEQIQGQINYLADLADLATIQVGVTQTPAAVPIVDEPWAPAEAAREAVRSLVTSLQSMAEWVIGFVIYTLPVLLLALAVPGLLLYLAYRRFWKGRTPAPRPTPAES
jgi:hypothetical protein